MVYLIDNIIDVRTKIGKNWYISRLLSGPSILRLKDAWLVLRGKADAVRFIQNSEEPAYRQYDFSIRCRMKNRWTPHFLAMLKYMETLGYMGASRKVGIYADGDGDFHSQFFWDTESLSSDAKPIKDENGNRLYDAG